MGPHTRTMSFVPYARGYGYPYAGYGYGAYGAGYPVGYGAYGPSLEEVKKIREAEEKAFKEAEDRAKELMEAEKKQYEEFREAQKRPSMTPSPRRRSSTRRSVSWQSSSELHHSHMGTQDMDMVGMVLASMAHEQAMATHMVDTAMAASTKRYPRLQDQSNTSNWSLTSNRIDRPQILSRMSGLCWTLQNRRT